jgi:type I restriction enzyme S subunit
MSFPSYSSYKDSGVDWLGQLPFHWDVAPLKYSTLVYTGNSLNESEKKLYESTDPESLPYISSKDIDLETHTVQYENGLRIPKSESEFKIAPSGTFLLCIEGGSAGRKIALLNRDVCFVNKLCCFSSRKNNRFVFFFAQSKNFKDKFGLSLTGMIGGVSTYLLKNFQIPVPSDQEQIAIADFLDRETAKIDELVSEQQKLIELLKEKRQAVISHAVTKGLNPNAPMKDSGIEWLGQVPAHWEVLKGSLIGKLFGSEQVPEGQIIEEGDLPFIKVASLSSDSFVIKSWDWFVHRLHSSQYRTRNNFIVLPKRGAAIFLNKVNIVNRPSLIDPNLMGWEIGSRADASFIAYALKSRRLDELADISSVPQINNKHIGPERFPLPPLKEQRLIVAFLAGELSKLDTLIQEALKAINLLQERRSALISAAVTGQIDVRTQPQK